MDKKLKVIIIDDEELARKLIRTFLEKYPGIEILGECGNGFDGIKLVQEHQPDLIFLDIQMPKLTGFEMLELMDDYPSIIFTTAYDQYALKAFEINAVDYLLKPFSRERFDLALKRVLSEFESEPKNIENQNHKFQAISEQQVDFLNRIVVKTGSKVKIIPVEDVHYLEAQDDFVMIYTSEGKYLKGRTMKYYESHLQISDFIRVHRSYIVKVSQIVQIEPYEKDSQILILKCGAKIPVSKSGYTRLKEALNF